MIRRVWGPGRCGLTTATLLVTVALARIAGAADAGPSTFVPRLTFIEVQYPQGVAASAGTWFRFFNGDRRTVGVVGDIGVGLSGVSIAAGPGVSSPDSTEYERIWSFGLQGSALRTWPWWSPWLATSRTFVGGEVFAAYFAVRCSVGAMVATSDASPFVVGGCGVGLP